MKKCYNCKEEKNIDDFAFKVESRGTRQPWCRACQKTYRKRHYELNREKYVNKAIVRNKSSRKKNADEFKDKPCVDCGIKYPPCVMDFDHCRGEKLINVSKLFNGHSRKRVLEEIGKCDILCANCHRLRGQKRRDTITL